MDINHFFNHQLPQALQNNPQEALEFRSGCIIAIKDVGEWYIDCMGDVPVCSTSGDGMDIRFTMRATSSNFIDFLEGPNNDAYLMWVQGKIQLNMPAPPINRLHDLLSLGKS